MSASSRSRSRCRGSCSERRWARAGARRPLREGLRRLADLEVRQRMTGRWVMAMIQTSFAIMPAASTGSPACRSRDGSTRSRSRRWSPSPRCRHGSSSRSVAALRQPRRADVARPLRPDLRVPRPADRHRGEEGGAIASAVAGDVRFEGVWFRYEDDGLDPARGSSLAVPAGTRTASSGRRARARPRSATWSRACTTRSAGRYDRRRRHARPRLRVTLARRRRRLAGDLSLPRHGAENLRFAQPDATDEEIEAAARAARIHDADRAPARRLRHRRRRARLPLLRRREAAHRDSAHDPARPADPGPRRGHERARHRDRARRAGGARPARRGTHDDRDRPPPLHRSRRRPDRGARPRTRAVERGRS